LTAKTVESSRAINFHQHLIQQESIRNIFMRSKLELHSLHKQQLKTPKK